jgi:hypothetical protein
MNLPDLRTWLRTSIRRWRSSTDPRWADRESLLPDWHPRTTEIARLIPPNTRVLEFGAGRLNLIGCLPEGCSYTPCDLVDRGHGTIVCDLNGPELPSFAGHDVAVFSGVLEYVHNVERLIAHLSRDFPVIVASYAVRDLNPKRRKRRMLGWVNDHSAAEIEDILARYRYRCGQKAVWQTQALYRFEWTQADRLG